MRYCRLGATCQSLKKPGSNALNTIPLAPWLANKMAEFSDYLKAGEIIISGSVVTPVKVQPGGHINITFTRLGSVSATFV